MQNKQEIKCGVTSCEHYDRGGCTLKSINVQPCTSCNSSHKKEDQSMCSSYKASMS